jgi:molecular chaperone GrpE (heat shock protein)
MSSDDDHKSSSTASQSSSEKTDSSGQSQSSSSTNSGSGEQSGSNQTEQLQNLEKKIEKKIEKDHHGMKVNLQMLHKTINDIRDSKNDDITELQKQVKNNKLGVFILAVMFVIHVFLF